MKRFAGLLFLGVLSFGIGCLIRDEQAEKLGRKIGAAIESSESKEIKKFNDSIVTDYNRVQTQFKKIEPALKTVNDGGYKDATPMKQARSFPYLEEDAVRLRSRYGSFDDLADSGHCRGLRHAQRRR